MKQKLEGFFEPIEKTLEMLYETNHLENPSEFPFVVTSKLFLAPNGDYLCYDKDQHGISIEQFAEKLLIPPNGMPDESEIHIKFFKDLHIIKVTNNLKSNNRLDYIILSPITEAQLRTIYRTYKDIPDLCITYDIIDNDKPCQSSGRFFETCGNGYRELLADLRKMDYLLN